MTEKNIPALITRLRHSHLMLPRDTQLRAALDRTCEQMWIPKDPDLPWGPDNRGEQDAILVAGMTGAGKTETIRKHLKLSTSHFVDPAGQPTMIVAVKMPSPYSGKELARRILTKLDLVMAKDLTEVELWEAVITNLALHRVTLLHIDEFQRVTTHKALGRSEAQKVVERLAATLNELLMADEWPVSLLISGTPEIVSFWRTNLLDQVHRRTSFVIFEQITSEHYEILQMALETYAEMAGIGVDVDVNDLYGRIAMAAENTVGIALEFMQEVVVAAVRDGAKAVTIDHFTDEYTRRSGAAFENNLFAQDNWVRIGVRKKATLEDLLAAPKAEAA